MNLIKKGATDVTRYVMLVDSATGAPETGYTIADLDLQYTRNRTVPAAKVDATALAATDTPHTDNRAIQIDATSSPGLYRVDWPDAAFASAAGVDKVLLVVSGSGLHPAVEEIQLVNFDPEDGVRLGLTALPNAASDEPGGLPISDAGGLDLDSIINLIGQPGSGNLADDIGAIATAVDTEVASILSAVDTEVASILAAVDTEVASILTAVDTEIGAIKTATDKLDTAMEQDGAVYRFTTNALEQAPSGSGSGGSVID